eukprot:30088_1
MGQCTNNQLINQSARQPVEKFPLSNLEQSQQRETYIMPISDLNALLIHGYCRQAESHITIEPPIIPDVICLLVSTFYEREYFEIINDQSIKHMDGNLQQSICGKKRMNPNTSYGAISIPTSEDNQCIYNWTLKVFNLDEASYDVYIGIDEYSKYQALCTSFAGLDCRSNYAYSSRGKLCANRHATLQTAPRSRSRSRPLRENLRDGDIITMRLDLIENTLSFFKNDRALKNRFANIERGKYLKYRLAVCIQGAVTVSLLDSNIQR